MSTEFFNDQWRIPSNENQNKVSNYSMEFDGSSSYIDAGSASYLNGLSQFSISVWFNLHTAADAKCIISDWNYNTSPFGHFSLRTVDTSGTDYALILYIKKDLSDAGSNAVKTSVIFTENTWYNVVFTYNSGTITYYVNGSSVSSTTIGTIASNLFDQDGILTIGNWPGLSQYWDGQIDQVSIFDYELSATQVSTLYGGGTAITNPMSLSPKPISYYQLGDQSAYNGANYLVPNNSLSDYDFKFDANSTYSSGDRIDISGINKALAGATSMSMTFWVYLTPAVYNNGMVFRMDTFPGTIQLRFVRYGNSRGPVWMFSMSDGTNSSGPSGSTSTATRPNFYNSDFLPSPAGSNIWWNITCTWDGSTMKVYRDASTQSGRWGTYAGTIPSSADSKASLGSNTSLSLFMDGRISNVAFWRNYTLTQDEVTEVYNNGAPLDLNSFSGAAPEAWYKLDSSEIFNNASTEWSVDNNAYPSVYKSSLNFDGSNNYISCGAGATLNQVTISAWVRESIATNYGTVAGVHKASDNSVPYMLIKSSAASKIIRFRATQSDGTDVQINSNPILETNTWYHVVGVADGSSIKMYINGELQTQTNSYNGTLATPNTDFTIGKFPVSATFPNNYQWDGQISNVALFNTGLSQSQVTTLYNNGTPEASISHSPLSWWKLDNTTTGIQDSAGSNDGTNNGATEYAGFVNTLAGESTGMDSANLVVSDLQQTSGYSPYALDFDGVDDRLDLSSAIDLGINSSISVWVNLDANYYGVLLGDDSYSLGKYFIQARYNDFFVRVGANFHSFPLTYPALTAGSWHHLAVTRSGDSVSTYVDGTFIETQTGFGINTPTRIDSIADRQSSSLPLEGKIAQLSAFNTTLSSSQITEIYNQGHPSNLHNFSGTAPVSWWQLGSNSSYNSGAWTCLDEIGTNNAVSVGNMTNDAITDGVGYSASGVGSSSIDIKGDAPYSTANGLSENMDVLDRTTDVPS